MQRSMRCLPPDQLKDAGILKAETMQTVYLENQGSKGFALHQLPLQAQYSPVYGIVAADINHDGKKDILLAGNNHMDENKIWSLQCKSWSIAFG